MTTRHILKLALCAGQFSEFVVPVVVLVLGAWCAAFMLAAAFVVGARAIVITEWSVLGLAAAEAATQSTGKQTEFDCDRPADCVKLISMHISIPPDLEKIA